MDKTAKKDEKIPSPKGAASLKSVVGWGLGLGLGALAGIVVGLLVGVGIAMVLGVL